MRVAAIVGLLAAWPVAAAAEALPPGSLGIVLGATSGAGADARSLGYGYQIGGQAAWQPTTTERRFGWSLKWTAVFGTMYSASAARINDELLTLQMDAMVGVRIRPSDSPTRYVTLRAGGAMFRANQLIPPQMHRAFVGPVASVGLDQHVSGWMFNVDVRYGLIGNGPTELGLLIGVSKTGP